MSKSNWRRGIGVACLFAASAVAAEASSPVFPSRPIALTGQQALEDGSTFTGFGFNIALNAPGDVGFAAASDGPGGSQLGTWFHTGDGLSNMVLTGDPIPGTPYTVALPGLPMPSTADRRFATVITIAGEGIVPESNDRMVVVGTRSSDLIVLGQTGTSAPGAPEFTYDDFLLAPSMADNGDVLFGAVSTNTGPQWGLWKFMPGTGVTEIVRHGQQIPNMNTGLTWIGTPLYTMNESGRFLLAGGIEGESVDETNNAAIWEGNSASDLQLVIRRGDTAPGTNAQVETINHLRINNAGDQAYLMGLTGAEVTSENRRGIWLRPADTGQISLYVRDGDPAPGTGGSIFQNVAFPGINDRLDLVFGAHLEGPTSTPTGNSLWLGLRDEEPVMLARQFEAIPGTGPTDSVMFSSFTGARINNAGQVAFLGILQGFDVDANSDQGLFAYDPDLGLHTIARTGSPFLVAEGDERIVSRIEVNSSAFPDRFGLSLNDSGMFSYFLEFSDGTSGIFVTMIPEPAGAATMLLIGAGLLARRRRAVT